MKNQKFNQIPHKTSLITCTSQFILMLVSGELMWVFINKILCQKQVKQQQLHKTQFSFF
jgi:hypothetical protein